MAVATTVAVACVPKKTDGSGAKGAATAAAQAALPRIGPVNVLRPGQLTDVLKDASTAATNTFILQNRTELGRAFGEDAEKAVVAAGWPFPVRVTLYASDATVGTAFDETPGTRTQAYSWHEGARDGMSVVDAPAGDVTDVDASIGPPPDAIGSALTSHDVGTFVEYLTSFFGRDFGSTSPGLKLYLQVEWDTLPAQCKSPEAASDIMTILRGTEPGFSKADRGRTARHLDAASKFWVDKYSGDAVLGKQKLWYASLEGGSFETANAPQSVGATATGGATALGLPQATMGVQVSTGNQTLAKWGTPMATRAGSYAGMMELCTQIVRSPFYDVVTFGEEDDKRRAEGAELPKGAKRGAAKVRGDILKEKLAKAQEVRCSIEKLLHLPQSKACTEPTPAEAPAAPSASTTTDTTEAAPVVEAAAKQ